MSCQQITAKSFVDYWCGDLATTDAEELEEHLFTCEDCARRAGELARTAMTLRDAMPRGEVASLTLTRSALDRLERDGVPVRHYTVRRGETVACQATPDHFSVVHLRLDTPPGTRRIDAAIETAQAETIHYEQVSINHADGEVSLAWPGEMVRAQPSGILSLTLSEVDGMERRVLGKYRLSHSAAED